MGLKDASQRNHTFRREAILRLFLLFGFVTHFTYKTKNTKERLNISRSLVITSVTLQARFGPCGVHKFGGIFDRIRHSRQKARIQFDHFLEVETETS